MIPNEKKKNMRLSCGKQTIYSIERSNMKHHGVFYCLNCLHSLRTENKLQCCEKACKNKYFCRIVMPAKKDNILEFNQHLKSDKM